MRGLTKRQREVLDQLHEEGFLACSSSFGRSQTNRVLWNLVEKGLAVFDFGPKDSFLRVQGFYPADESGKQERGES